MKTAVRYEVVPARPAAHYFTVRLFLQEPDPAGVTVALPAWIPGSYMIRDFARNLVSIRASCGGRELPVVALDKQSWQVEGAEGELVLEYQVYAWERSVRAAHLDQRHAFFNGTSLFLRVEGREAEPCEVELAPPAEAVWGHWRVATTLPLVEADGDGFGRYRAEDYWHLVDCPVEMGEFRSLAFTVGEVAHQMVISGRAEFDAARLARDLARICEAQVALFGELPLSRYLFLVAAVGEGYGGLEHRDSCALLCSRDDLPAPGVEEMTTEYRRFLGLCSHEYFHLWNVKRIRPAQLAGSRLEREAHTRLLWAFEGITSYYDELMLVRSGVIDADSYLELLAQTITRLLRTPGRRLQSVADSSFHAWTRFYQQDENAPNAIVSYYTKGALVALGLDVELRLRSGDRLCLDDLMRRLWERYGRVDRALPEEGMRAEAEALLGSELGDFFEMAVEGTGELPLERWLAELGVGFRLRTARDEKDLGGVAKEGEREGGRPHPFLGAQWVQKGEFLELTRVLEGGPAQAAGLSAGDRLVAVAGIQATPANLDRLLALPPGRETVEVAAFREDELHLFTLRPEPAPADTCELWLLPEESAGGERIERRNRWLGSL